jgi:SAM-dependent methyltransferase
VRAEEYRDRDPTDMTIPKPKHLGRDYADQFGDAAVVAAYHHRPPYSPQIFPILRDLVVDTPRVVLDLGCGTGDVARPLAAMVDAVDAIDCAPRMLERGKGLPGGDRPNRRWILGRAEEASFPRATYGLVTAGESLHWMDWDRLFPRLCTLLAPCGHLAILGRPELPRAWSADLIALIQRYSTNRDYQPYDLIDELSKRGLFELYGEEHTEPLLVRQSHESFVESIHSRNGFSRDRMTRAAAAAFDAEVERLLASHFLDRAVEFEVIGRIVWGRPQTPLTSPT